MIRIRNLNEVGIDMTEADLAKLLDLKGYKITELTWWQADHTISVSLEKKKK